MGSVRDLADRYLADVCVLDPIQATRMGLPGDESRLTDYSPDGEESRRHLAVRTLAALDGIAEPDADEAADRWCASLLRDRLSTELELADAGEPLRALRIIGSPVELIRGVFDAMATETADDWSLIGARLASVPAAYKQFAASLREGMSHGLFAAPRQALACADQASTWAGDNNGGSSARPWFVNFVEAAPQVLRSQLATSAVEASIALRSFASFLRHEYVPAAAEQPDAVGPERYGLWARHHVGARVDQREAYDWAWDELAHIEADMAATAGRVRPGATVAEAIVELETLGPALDGEDALIGWLQELIDSTIEALDGTHVDIAEPMRRCQAMIAPAGSAAAQYYTVPSADFSRPGRTWNPTLGRTHFPLWAETSTCFHEAVPGHHLQLAQWVLEGEALSRFQTSVYTSGNIEGWALYAERLMDELGFLVDPGSRLGYLSAQQMRAVRVIVDIGMHNELTLPAGQPFHPRDRWTSELGRSFLHAHVQGRPVDFIDSEWIRYLGWPGQAISYKLGERVWLAGREAARRNRGSAFDLKAWHMAALRMGSLGLDDLAVELAAI